MIPGINQRKMAQMMKRMGIQQTEVDAKEVIIKTEDKEIVITNPSVYKVDMMGQQTFQIAGQINERPASSEAEELEISEDDINTVIEQTSCSEEEAIKMIKETKGNLAEAIIRLKSDV